MDEIINENCAFLSLDNFKKVYKYGTNEKYQFLFCMIKKGRMMKNFTTEISNEHDGILF